MSRNAITITHMNGGAHRRARIVPVLNDSPTKEELIQIALLQKEVADSPVAKPLIYSAIEP